MKKGIIFTTIFLLFVSAFAQQPTVEEIYAKYITAIGGSEKLNSVTNKMVVSSLVSEYSSKGVANIEGTAKQGIINLWDYAGQQSATILKQYPSALTGNKILFTRYFTANGQITTLLSDGKKTVSPSGQVDRFLKNPFPETVVPSGSKVLPNETFDGKEVYVINYEQPGASGLTSDCYVYFDIDSGLLLGSKVIIEQEVAGSHITTININHCEDYREVEGILVSHKVTQEMTQEMTGATNMTTENKIITESIAIIFNMDVEDFKNNCFQQPEACFEKYENN